MVPSNAGAVGMERGGQVSGDRWFRAGRSIATDARAAGREAASVAQASEPAKLLVVFSSASYDAGQVLEGVCSVTPHEVPGVGGTSMGELAGDGAGAEDPTVGPAVVAAALGGDGFSVSTLVVPQASDNRREAGIASASVMKEIVADHKVMLMIVDGLTREQHELVRGAYSVLGASVPIVGGCSADNLEYQRTLQFHGTGAGVDQLVDSIVAVGIGSTGPFGVGIGHGWEKDGEPMVVTRSEGGEVFLIDNEPALDVYLRYIGVERAVVEDAEKFKDVAFEHPLGLSRASGEDIRVVHGADPSRGSLFCLADVPQGALVWTMKTDVPSLVAAAARSCQMAVDGLGDAGPIGMLVFDCGARKLKLGPEHLQAEQNTMAAAVRTPFAGFYTYGEVARTKGSRGMHHLTVASLAIG
jgi:hypothetical protein